MICQRTLRSLLVAMTMTQFSLPLPGLAAEILPGTASGSSFSATASAAAKTDAVDVDSKNLGIVGGQSKKAPLHKKVQKAQKTENPQAAKVKADNPGFAGAAGKPGQPGQAHATGASAKTDSGASHGQAESTLENKPAAAQNETSEPAAPVASTEKGLSSLVHAENSFGLSTYRYLGDAASAKNIFVSPLSLHTCLHMVFNGAEGETAAEMARVLGLSSENLALDNQKYKQLVDELKPREDSQEPSFVFSTANSLWVNDQVKLKPAFAEMSKDVFSAEVRNLDFGKVESVGTINSWVNEKTHGKIPQIIDQLTPQQMLVAVNAAYFKARWKTVFNKQLTKDADFTTASLAGKKVPMMEVTGDFHYLENEQMQAVELPYEGGKTSLIVCLPSEKSTLKDFRHALTASSFSSLVDQMQSTPGQLFLPRFTMHYDVFCKELLKAAGMQTAFSDKADFSGIITPPPQGKLSEVMHKTFVKVDEEGTEAAAATAVVERALSLLVEKQAEPFKMVVNRPFFFAVMNWKTRAILFVGQIADPAEG